MTPPESSRKLFMIRPMQVDDHDAWLQLWNAYIQFYDARVPTEVTEATWQRLLGDGGHQGLVCVNQSTSKVIGFTTYLFHPSTWTLAGYCYLEDLFVDSAHRGNGAGRELIHAVVELANQAKITRVYWHTDTDNTAARRLYDSVGDIADFVQYRITNKR